MKQYTLLEEHMGLAQGTIIFGPYPILGQSAKGYYTKDAIETMPSTNCIFASAVENTPSVFSEVKQQENSQQ